MERDKNNKNIQPGYKNGIWHKKKCVMLRVKSGKKQTMEGIELPSGHH